MLWRQRHLLELLLFKLDVEQTLLASGRLRWLARATHEVELVLDEIRHIELTRSMAIDEVASSLGLHPGCTLRELADAAPAPWDGIFAEHREAFLGLTEEINLVARANRDLVSQGQRAVSETLDLLVPGLDDDEYVMRSSNVRRAAVLVDEVL